MGWMVMGDGRVGWWGLAEIVLTTSTRWPRPICASVAAAAGGFWEITANLISSRWRLSVSRNSLA